MSSTPNLTRYAWLSVAAALITISLKTGAYLVTNSVGLLSDALESLVNLAAALLALVMLYIAAQPPDDEHAFGHEKAEYFSSGVEGGLILVTAVAIAVPSVYRLLHPHPLGQLSLGLALALGAALVNGAVAYVLNRVGKKHRSITLEADAQHLLADVYTGAGVILGVLGVHLTGWLYLDPLVGLAVATHITFSGYSLVRRSALGLLDTALPNPELDSLNAILSSYCKDGIAYHALRTRRSGRRNFVEVHVLVPGDWSVRRGHDLLEEIEAEIRETLPGTHVLTHLEPLEDPCSFEDIKLDREPAASH